MQNVLDLVAKHEVGGTGKPSNACRAVEWEWYVNVLMAARDHFLSQHKEQFMIVLLFILTFQWQFIARNDDMMRLVTSTIHFNSSDQFMLHVKNCCSKNIRTERESPTHIMLAAMVPIVCPMLSLAVLMETVGLGAGLLYGRCSKTAANLLKHVYDGIHIGKRLIYVWREPIHVCTLFYIQLIFFMFCICKSSFSCNPK